MTFANEGRKIWQDLTPEEKGALLLAHHEGEEIQFELSGVEWIKAEPSWEGIIAYRVRPKPEPTPMVIPWEALADWVQWVAQDENCCI